MSDADLARVIGAMGAEREHVGHCAADVRWVGLESVLIFNAIDHVVDGLKELLERAPA